MDDGSDDKLGPVEGTVDGWADKLGPLLGLVLGS